MPSLGADMERGTIIRWLVKPGDPVRRGDIVAEVETEKADMDIEVFSDGVIADIVVGEGEEVPVGAVIAHITVAAGETGPPPAAAPARPAQPVPAAPPDAPATPMPRAPHVRITPTARALAAKLGVDITHLAGSGVGGAITRADVEAAVHAPRAVPHPAPSVVRASPYARRRAAELGVDLAAVTGSGPRGAITVGDVERGAPSEAAPIPAAPVRPAPEERGLRIAARRKAIGALMDRSKREIPHYYLASTIDVSAALRWLEGENRTRPVADRILPSALLLRAAALAAHDVPELNGYWLDGDLVPQERVHLGVVISLREGGIVAPAIHDVDRLSLGEVMAALRDLVMRARAGKLRASEMSEATITVTNLGDLGAEIVHGVIYPPQVALVGFGRIVERPWAENGMLGVRRVVQATLAADHRASDGHRGSRFLAAIERHLQEPDTQ